MHCVSSRTVLITLAWGACGCAAQGSGDAVTAPVAEPAESSAPGVEPQEQAQRPRTLSPGGFTCPAAASAGTLDVPSAPPELLAGITNHFQGFGNFEGPVWLDDSLVFSNIAGGANPPQAVIRRWTGDGDATVLYSDSGSNGLAVDAQGALVAARHSDGSVTRLAVTGGDEQQLVADYKAQRFNSPNDLSFASDGTFYFTDPTWQAPSPLPQKEARAYFVRDSEATPVGVLGAPENPNGIATSPDGRFLYIGGVNGLYRYSLNADGTTTSPGLLIQSESLSDETGIDGLGRDCAGNLYVTAHAQKLVVILDSNSKEVATIPVPSAGGITNVAFGGPSRSSLFITSLGEEPQIHRIELGVVGYPY